MEDNQLLRGTLNQLKDHEGATITNIKEVRWVGCSIEEKATYKIESIYCVRDGGYPIIDILLLLHTIPVKQRHKVLRVHAYDDKEPPDSKVVHEGEVNPREVNVRGYIKELAVHVIARYNIEQGVTTGGDTEQSITTVCDKEAIFWEIGDRDRGGSVREEINGYDIADSDTVHEREDGEVQRVGVRVQLQVHTKAADWPGERVQDLQNKR